MAQGSFILVRYVGLVLVGLLFNANADAKEISLGFSQKYAQASFGFSVGPDSSASTDIDFGLFADTEDNFVYFARVSVGGNIDGTNKGWRFAGGGQLNIVTYGKREKRFNNGKDPEAHSIDLYFASSWTLSGSVPIEFGLEINYSPEILSYGDLENKFSYNTYINFHILPAFVMGVGYQGQNYFLKPSSVSRFGKRFFIGMDILF